MCAVIPLPGPNNNIDLGQIFNPKPPQVVIPPTPLPPPAPPAPTPTPEVQEVSRVKGSLLGIKLGKRKFRRASSLTLPTPAATNNIGGV